MIFKFVILSLRWQVCIFLLPLSIEFNIILVRRVQPLSLALLDAGSRWNHLSRCALAFEQSTKFSRRWMQGCVSESSSFPQWLVCGGLELGCHPYPFHATPPSACSLPSYFAGALNLKLLQVHFPLPRFCRMITICFFVSCQYSLFSYSFSFCPRPDSTRYSAPVMFFGLTDHLEKPKRLFEK